MESPIQLKFFKKIELYQDYKFENKKALTTELQDWKIETIILGWTRMYHHHLYDPLTENRVREDILRNKYSHEHKHAMESLIQRGYAELHPDGIRITKEGLLMGEVIYEVENSWLSKLKYQGLFWLVWITAIAGALTVIINFINLIS